MGEERIRDAATTRLNLHSARVGLLGAVIGMAGSVLAIVKSDKLQETVNLIPQSEYNELLERCRIETLAASALKGEVESLKSAMSASSLRAQAAERSLSECAGAKLDLADRLAEKNRHATDLERDLQKSRTEVSDLEGKVKRLEGELEVKGKTGTDGGAVSLPAVIDGLHDFVRTYDGIEVAVLRTRRAGKRVLVELSVTSKGENRDIRPQVGKDGRHAGTRGFDAGGIEFGARAVEVAGKRQDTPGWFQQQLVADVPTRALIEFENLPADCKLFSLLEFQYRWGGRALGSVEFTNLPVPYGP